MFKDKYLRYQPEITFEIFKLVCDKISKSGIELETSAETEYKYFQHWKYLIPVHNGTQFGSHDYAKGLTETTVQEILGYDPFVKEFVLPEKWCIKLISQEINNAVNSIKLWKDGNLYWDNAGGYNSYFIGNDGIHSCNLNKEGYTEITFDQFKKYVLKEPIEQPKSIEKWSVGSYVVCIKDYSNSFIFGNIGKIEGPSGNSCIDISKSRKAPCIPFKNNCEWFATKAEAEEFAKTLIEPVKRAGFPIEGCCETKSNELEQYLIKTRGTSDSKTTKSKATGIGWNEGSYWWLVDITKSSKRKYHLSDLEVWLDKPKQPLKQAVHCKTQEEWDFVNKKLGNDCKNWFANPAWGNNKSFCISFDDKNQSQTLECYQKAGYQILSFQEWCDLNGYKMENKSEFKVGDWVTCTKERAGYNGKIGKLYQLIEIKKESLKFNDYNGLHPREVGVRHATQEEINNHLISIGQIPAGEPIDCGIEPNKDGIFKYTTVPGASFGDNYSSAISYSNSSGKPQEILIKSEIKLNYLPEPK